MSESVSDAPAAASESPQAAQASPQAARGSPPAALEMSKFEAFWVDYLRAHSRRSTRVCHYIATFWGVTVGFYGIFTLQPLFVLAGIAGGYIIAVGSHYVFEGSPPLVARSAWMGAVSDFRVIWLALTGRLDAEFDKYGLENRSRRW